MKFVNRQEEVPRLAEETALGRLGSWGPASRWWHGNHPEWDVASDSLDGERVLLGEVKWSTRPYDRKSLEAALRELSTKPAPPLPSRLAGAQLVRALFAPEVDLESTRAANEIMLVTVRDLL